MGDYRKAWEQMHSSYSRCFQRTSVTRIHTSPAICGIVKAVQSYTSPADVLVAGSFYSISPFYEHFMLKTYQLSAFEYPRVAIDEF